MRRGKEIDFLVLMRAKARAAVLASYPADTVSGAVASFPDGADGVPVVDLTVHIEPVQEGSGDPSPENIRLISGWTGANVTRTGKNLLPKMQTQTSSGATITVAADGSIRVSGTADSQTSFGGSQFTLAPGEYILSGAPSGSLAGSYDLYLRNQMTSTIIARSYDNSPYMLFTLSEATPCQIRVRVPQGAMDTAKVFYPMIRVSSNTEAVYAPYVESTYSVSWQTEAGTVYGGTLDVTTGVLTVTHGQIASYAGETLPGEWISDRDVYAEGTSPTAGAQVVYALAEPVTYQLAPAQIRTLLGNNNIWADCGAVEVEYRADLEKYIEKKTGGVGTLSLGAAPSLIRPGAGLEMQPLGPDDAGVDYIDEIPDADDYLGDLEDEEENYPEDTEEEELTEEPEEGSDDEAGE